MGKRKLRHRMDHDIVMLEDFAIIGIAYERGYELEGGWRNRICTAKLYNEIVDWLIVTYPDEFEMEKD